MPKKEPFDFEEYAGLKRPAPKRPAEPSLNETLTKELMVEAGLGFEPSWYDGASCLVCRRSAFERLVSGIRRRHLAGVRISPPVRQLFAQLADTIKFEERHTPYRLHRTHQVARMLIEKHIEIAMLARNQDRAMAVDDAKFKTRHIIDEPQTEEEREAAKRKAAATPPAPPKNKIYHGDRRKRR